MLPQPREARRRLHGGRRQVKRQSFQALATSTIYRWQRDWWGHAGPGSHQDEALPTGTVIGRHETQPREAGLIKREMWLPRLDISSAGAARSIQRRDTTVPVCLDNAHDE